MVPRREAFKPKKPKTLKNPKKNLKNPKKPKTLKNPKKP